MIKAIKSKSKILIILLVLALLLPLLFTVGFAIYTSISGKKGIVTVGGSEICNYSSDKLNNYQYGSELESALDNQIQVKFADNNRAVGFNIKNTNVKGNGLPNRYDISYNIIFGVKNLSGDDITGEANVTVSKDSAQISFDANGVSTSTYYLNGGTAETHSYTINFPEGCEDTMIVSVEARPTAESKAATLNTTLYRQFVPTEAASVDYGFSCEGGFSDNTDEAGNTTELYHAFNYLVTVSGGAGTVTLEWRTAYLTLEDAFFYKVGRAKADASENDGIASLSFAVDASVIEQSYDIVFYKAAGFPQEAVTWADMDYDGAEDADWFVKVAGVEN